MLNIKESFKFQKSTYKKVPVFSTYSFFKKPLDEFAEEVTFFSLVIIRNLYGEAGFCVKSKTNSGFTVKL